MAIANPANHERKPLGSAFAYGPRQRSRHAASSSGEFHSPRVCAKPRRVGVVGHGHLANDQMVRLHLERERVARTEIGSRPHTLAIVSGHGYRFLRVPSMAPFGINAEEHSPVALAERRSACSPSRNAPRRVSAASGSDQCRYGRSSRCRRCGFRFVPRQPEPAPSSQRPGGTAHAEMIGSGMVESACGNLAAARFKSRADYAVHGDSVALRPPGGGEAPHGLVQCVGVQFQQHAVDAGRRRRHQLPNRRTAERPHRRQLVPRHPGGELGDRGRPLRSPAFRPARPCAPSSSTSLETPTGPRTSPAAAPGTPRRLHVRRQPPHRSRQHPRHYVRRPHIRQDQEPRVAASANAVV